MLGPSLPCDSIEEFRHHVVEFFGLVGDRRVIFDEHRSNELMRGLGLLYLGLDVSGDDEAEAARLFEAASLEFSMRRMIVETSPPSPRPRDGGAS